MCLQLIQGIGVAQDNITLVVAVLQDLVQPAFASLSSEFFFFSVVLQLEIDLTLMHCESHPFLEM